MIQGSSREMESKELQKKEILRCACLHPNARCPTCGLTLGGKLLYNRTYIGVKEDKVTWINKVFLLVPSAFFYVCAPRGTQGWRYEKEAEKQKLTSL